MRFGSPAKIDYREKVGALILTSLLEDLVVVPKRVCMVQHLDNVHSDTSPGHA